MSHISDLIKPAFNANEPAPSLLRKLWKRRAFLGAASLMFVGGLGFAIYRAGASTPPPAPNMVVPVTVAAVEARPVRLWSEFSGRMVAVDSADVRPQVDGRITDIRFKDGQDVHAGDILFVIDPRTYEAAAAKAQADVVTAETNARLARTELDRASNLIKANAVAKDYFDQKANANGTAQAAIQSAQAALTQAKLNVDFAYVKAPISGRVGRAELTVGNLVQSSPTAPLLTTIVSRDGIYADFDVDEQTYMENVRAHATTADQEHRIPVELTVQGDADHVYKGTIESFDNKISTSTGTIRARARFTNEDGSLVPGMFVSVRLAGAADSRIILVPEDAIGNDQSKRFVFVVGHDHKAMFREVTLGQAVGDDRVVTQGLKPGEEVVVAGLQKLQPGALVSEHFADGSQPRRFAAR
ncbi:MAG TPA: efflux RND transporter periplasmic adaptor subunit [Rhizomicrobium sp.]|nr:efflux RND transporter periplasmic adaptor subunit [Rhizomicrobium sp.]